MSDLTVPIEYDNWATQTLADFCATLSPAQLALTTPGTMGTIEATVVHLVAAKERYAANLGGFAPPADAAREGQPTDLGHVAARARALGTWFAGYAKGDLDLTRDIERKTAAGVVQHARADILLAQFLHHGNEHRAQLGSIFGAHGVKGPGYSAFDWGRERGLFR